MWRSGSTIFASLLLSVAISLTAHLDAQVLEHRPAGNPETPGAKAGPARNDEALVPAKPVLAQGTNLQVEVTRHYPMKANEAIDARLLHPIFAHGELVVPQGALLHGKVVALGSDAKARLHARLRGDFTPFHTVQVQFDELELAGGAVAISANRAHDGSPVLHLSAPGVSPRQSVISRYWTQTKNQLHDRAAWFTAPGFGDRALQALYHQLPYHPERIEAHTMWSFELTGPLVLPSVPGCLQPTASHDAAGTKKPEAWGVNALLMADLTSASAKPGDPVEALVVEPVLDRDRQVVVPQGSVLVGKVSEAKTARSLGRNGKLRFNFQQVRFPEGAANRQVQGSLAGATAGSQDGLSLDAEGTITPRNQSSVIAPLLLTMLAGRALDEDGNITAQTGVASNGFGLVGRVVGLAAGNRNLAAGIGYYAAALSVYENFLRRGRDVKFQKNTRIQIETTPLRAPVLTPSSQ